MEKTPRMIAASLLIAGSLAGCAKANDGQVLNVANETSCWSMPGGKNVSRMDRTLAQRNQSDMGDIAKGVQVIVTKGDSGVAYDVSGYVQAEVPNVHGENPSTGEEIDLGSRTCWIKSADLKK
jgi:hypothetical protein